MQNAATLVMSVPILFTVALLLLMVTLNKNNGKNMMPLKTLNGLPYLWRYRPGGRGSPGFTWIGIELDAPFDFLLLPEGKGQKLAKWMGFATEFQTGDTVFDDQVYIDCDFLPFCEKLRDSSELRRAISGLLQTQVKSLTLSGGRLVALLKQPNSVPDEDTAEAVAGALNDIKRLMPSNYNMQDVARPRFSPSQIASVLIVGLFTIGVVASVYDAVQPYEVLSKTNLMQMTGGVGLMAILAMLIVIWLVFHGSARGYDVLKVFLLGGIIGAMLCAFAALYNINIYFDTAPAETHDQLITSKYFRVTHNKHGTSRTYYVNLMDWHGSAGVQNIRVNYNTYNYAREGVDKMRMITHPGYLGTEWIESRTLLPQAQGKQW